MTDDRLFIASIGTGNYRAAAYQFDDRSWQTPFAPVATARLLALNGWAAAILVTDAARRRWYDRLAAELVEAGLQPEPIDIPEGRNEDEILQIFSRLVARVPKGARVVLDVTFALRHLPFVYLATLAYLTGLRNVKIEGIYYGAYELKTTGSSVPILDITVLFQLLRWYHALAATRDSGEWLGVARALRTDVSRLFQRGAGDPQLSRLQTPTEQLAHALAMGLPIEAGLRARQLSEALAAVSKTEVSGLASRLALGALQSELPNWAVDAAGTARKQALALTTQELVRQLRLARWYADHHDLDKALLVLREWLVSALLHALGRAERWLDYGQSRKPVEDLLNALCERSKANVASDPERAVSSLWDEIATKRNRLAHAGMTEQEVSVSAAEVAALVQRCEALLAGETLGQISWPGTARLLITPLGLSPGVVYSAVQLTAPDIAIIVTSRDARSAVSQAVERAGCADLPVQILEIADPHRGFREADSHLAVFDHLFVAAQEVVINVTGGTTVLQYVVERFADRARRLGTPVRRVALVDRRSPEAQRAEPYVLGELVDLNGNEGAAETCDE